MSGIQQLLLGGSPAGYQIERSLRFNSADSAYLNRTPASAGNRTTWTWSAWFKRGALSDANLTWLFGAGSTDETNIYLRDTDVFELRQVTSSVEAWKLTSTQVFRDPSAFYHLIVACDTTQATASNRLKVYVNGVQITSFSTASYPAQNNNTHINNNVAHYIGKRASASVYCNGLFAEINFIDGQALTPSSFGQSDPNTGVWSPIKYTGTYGTNGFYLNFSDSSNTTAATLGKDYSGNGNNWTPSGFSVTAGAGDDSVVDTPTSYGTNTGVGGEVRGNYATRNPLAASTTATGYPTNGNLDSVWSSGGSFENATTIGFDATDATGYYWEYLVNGTALSKYPLVGIANNDAVIAFTGKSGGSAQPGTTSGGWMFENASGSKFNNNSVTSYGTATTSGWGCVAVKNGKIFIGSISGGTITWKNSGNPITEANPMFSGITGTVFPTTSEYSSGTVSYNFGQKPFQATAPSGFKALCTQNLPTPTIGATSTTQAGKYMNVVLYTGDGNNGRSITGVGFQTDFNWTKSRSSGSYFHQLSDAVRGFDKYLYSNATNAEGTDATNHIQSVNSDGYVINSGASFNANTVTYVAWNWNAGGSNATNTSGTITSTVRANTTAGFSIVTFNIPGSGTSDTVGHGLGVAPSMVILKPRTAGTSWGVYHSGLTSAAYYLTLQTTNAQTLSNNWWNSTAPTSSVFTIGSTWYGTTNAVAYCFAPIAGYSAFGSYTGNGSSDGPFLYFGFRARYICYKRTDTTGNWNIIDTARNPYNQLDTLLRTNLSNADETNSVYAQDITANGWKIRSTNVDINVSGATYIYAAFAESPFKYSLAR